MFEFCNDCAPGCMPIVSDGCVTYTGPAIVSLGIKTGDSLLTVLQILGSQLTKITELSDKVTAMEAAVAGFSAGDILADTSLLSGTASVASAKITERSFNYSVDRSGSEYSLTYDLSNVRKGLPSDYTLLGVDSSLVDADGKKYSSSGTVSTLKTSLVPSTFDITATVRTPTGDIELVKRLSINSTVGSKGATLGIRDYTTSPEDVTQKEVNTILSQDLARVQEDLEQADVVGMQQSLATQESQIEGNTSAINTNKSDADTQIESLQTEIDELKKGISTLQQRNAELQTQVDNLN